MLHGVWFIIHGACCTTTYCYVCPMMHTCILSILYDIPHHTSCVIHHHVSYIIHQHASTCPIHHSSYLIHHAPYHIHQYTSYHIMHNTSTHIIHHISHIIHHTPYIMPPPYAYNIISQHPPYDFIHHHSSYITIPAYPIHHACNLTYTSPYTSIPTDTTYVMRLYNDAC